MIKGKFIVVEGLNGSGKTTQVGLLADLLRKKGSDIVVVRDPGGTPVGEKIRDLLRLGEEPIHVYTQVALFMAARTELYYRVIRPALDQGKVVISDRWIPTTIAHQCYALSGGPGISETLEMGNILLQSFRPDATLVLKVTPLIAHQRRAVQKQDQDDRWEKEGLPFQEMLDRAYTIMGDSYNRHKLVDGEGTPQEVLTRLVQSLDFIFTHDF